MADKIQNSDEKLTLDGREVHLRPNSVAKISAKKVISREELLAANSNATSDNDNIEGTSILDEQEQIKDAAKDRKPKKVQAKQVIYTPDTTVLGDDNFLTFEDTEPEIKSEKNVVKKLKKVVKKPEAKPKKVVEKKKPELKKVERKKVDKPKKIETKKDDGLKKISRKQLENSKIADDTSTTVIAEVEDKKPEKPKETKKSPKKSLTSKKTIKKAKLPECKLIRLSNKENILVTKDKFVVGKSKHSDYMVKGNNTVSRSHAIIHILDDNTFWIEDNESKNGTCVDGVYLKAHEQFKLEDDQTIRLSDEIFRVKIKG